VLTLTIPKPDKSQRGAYRIEVKEDQPLATGSRQSADGAQQGGNGSQQAGNPVLRQRPAAAQ
jgi:hypothetical protein